ncbi:MAG: hypothetical protein PHU25_02935 [Deltaproteobacteria bacterium]|nr:hypothetical protein [Deltaproteobacteria bacterium]
MCGRRHGLVWLFAAIGCACATPARGPAAGQGETASTAARDNMRSIIDGARIDAVAGKLVAKHGRTQEERVRRGLAQVALFWREVDGTPDDFEAFCLDQFVSDTARLDGELARYERNIEAISGHAVALGRFLREPTDLDTGEPLPVDILFAAFNPFDHASEDAFRTRVAFAALLNFRAFEPQDLKGLTRAQWAQARLTQGYSLRIPGEARQVATRAYTVADDYIANYNIHMGRLVAASGERPFPDDLVLISHWGLRDHIKAMYSDPEGNLARQRLIARVMERIIRQEIPAAVIDNPDVDWDPERNTVAARQGSGKPAPSAAREDDRRYAVWQGVFKAERGIDAWSPVYHTLISRKFDLEREIPEKTVEGLLVDVLSAPVAKDVAALIAKRLGRPLEPFDIWYDGFKARSEVGGDELDRKVGERYKDVKSFEASIPDILKTLAFTEEAASYLSGRILVDPARGAGHAMGAGMRSDQAHLRTRAPREGMNYKGYNIAMHELGHCVEQTFSLDKVDHTLLAGVPNTAFTEAFAFMFQDRDLDVLGIGTRGEREKALAAVDTYWMTFEIAGVALLDMASWRFMYDHPEATPAELREAVVTKAIEIWNRYYAPVLGVKDSPILAVYSHLVSAGLYMPDYPIGHLIETQLERYVEGRKLGAEMERMCAQGRITPDEWMRGAVGAPISARPLIDAATAAVPRISM